MPRRIALGERSSLVYQGRGCRQELLEHILQRFDRRVVISDSRVAECIRETIELEAQWLIVTQGEPSKCLQQAASLWDELCRLKVDRNTAVLGVGGGMIGDLAGFVAATYLRGLPFFSLPTSLLAMLDAAVGGKTAIDIEGGKNLVGAFYPALAVAIDTELLDSLPEPEWSSGMAEAIKHGILSGGELWAAIGCLSPERLQDKDERQRFVEQAVSLKLDVVEQDPYEKSGERAKLNLGHTLGHALEWCSDYRLRHGEAVALGLLAAVRLSRSMELLEEDFENELVSILRRWSLPTSLPLLDGIEWSWERIAEALGRDKKVESGAWRFILPAKPGVVSFTTVSEVDLVRKIVDSLKVAPEV